MQLLPRQVYYSSLIKGVNVERLAQDTSQQIEQFAKNFAIPLDYLKIVELEGLRLISSEVDFEASLLLGLVKLIY